MARFRLGFENPKARLGSVGKKLGSARHKVGSKVTLVRTYVCPSQNFFFRLNCLEITPGVDPGVDPKYSGSRSPSGGASKLSSKKYIHKNILL